MKFNKRSMFSDIYYYMDFQYCLLEKIFFDTIMPYKVHGSGDLFKGSMQIINSWKIWHLRNRK